jgi:hypothetical protein
MDNPFPTYGGARNAQSGGRGGLLSSMLDERRHVKRAASPHKSGGGVSAGLAAAPPAQNVVTQGGVARSATTHPINVIVMSSPGEQLLQLLKCLQHFRKLRPGAAGVGVEGQCKGWEAEPRTSVQRAQRAEVGAGKRGGKTMWMGRVANVPCAGPTGQPAVRQRWHAAAAACPASAHPSAAQACRAEGGRPTWPPAWATGTQPAAAAPPRVCTWGR